MFSSLRHETVSQAVSAIVRFLHLLLSLESVFGSEERLLFGRRDRHLDICRLDDDGLRSGRGSSLLGAALAQSALDLCHLRVDLVLGVGRKRDTNECIRNWRTMCNYD